ncbi:MAG: CPBP family intramembrane metalloprotease [Sphingobacteriia bacterium]|nr:CPBP family intramembrane metalloprotease [Sphingobacteriia bacterium]
MLAFVPVIATFFVAFLPTIRYITTDLLLVLLIYSLLNGCMEELFWRLTFNRIFGNSILQAYIIPTVIFSCWHIALLFANGVCYHGGAFALIGGAAMMGAIGGLVMFKTKSIRIVIVAHVLANFFAFSQLLYQNWFA